MKATLRFLGNVRRYIARRKRKPRCRYVVLRYDGEGMKSLARSVAIDGKRKRRWQTERVTGTK